MVVAGRTVAFVLVFMGGCLGTGLDGTSDGRPVDVVPAPGGAISLEAPLRAGLFDASPDGLVELESFPGLTITQEGATTRFSLDVREILVDNGDPLVLVQALANLTMHASFDVDVAYQPPLGNSDFDSPDAICIGTSIGYDRHENGFYFARALDQPATPPLIGEDADNGPGMGHARSGPTDQVIDLFGGRFRESEFGDWRVNETGFVRFSNFISQIDVRTATMPGNHWWQNWTVDGPVRVIRIPPAPVYCANGFGEFNDATVIGKPPFATTLGGFLDVETRYGSTVAINTGLAEPDPEPWNSATVEFLGRTCQVGPGKGASLSSFDPGLVRVSVDRWVGDTWMVLQGMGPRQHMMGALGPDRCES